MSNTPPTFQMRVQRRLRPTINRLSRPGAVGQIGKWAIGRSRFHATRTLDGLRVASLPEESAELQRLYLAGSGDGATSAAMEKFLLRIVDIETFLNSHADYDGAKRLADLWSFADAHFSPEHIGMLHQGFLDHANRARHTIDYSALMRLLAPLHARAPEDQDIYLAAFRLMRIKASKNDPDLAAVSEQWWAFCARAKPHLDDETIEIINRQTRNLGKKALDAGRLERCEEITLPLIRVFPEDPTALARMALLYEARKDWRTAASYWQLSAATATPIKTTNELIAAENQADGIRLANYALKGLRSARLKLAKELLAQGRTREYTEMVSRSVELLPDHRMMKKDPEYLDAIRTYVHHALDADGFAFPARDSRKTKPKRIAFCVDVLKVSEHYTHAKVMFAMCRNLMELDPEIETHIFITNERLTVSTPTMSPVFNLTRSDAVFDMARKALPDYFGTRFHLHFYKNFGLEGLVETCKDVLSINPDVVIYGGGHTGILSNESRSLRHCLFDFLPTTFFFIQANNEVDEKFDLIIARGPHAIPGTPGAVKIKSQPYPTLTSETAVVEPEYDRAKARSRILLSAVAGVRMDIRMRAQTEKDLKILFGILDNNPGTVWHFVGSNDPEELAKAMPLLRARIQSGQVVLHKLMPFTEFENIASNAALFLQLPGFTGGAGGAGIARRNGVPILTFEHSDVSGRQPAETVFAEKAVQKFARKADRLLKDHEEWERVARAQISHSMYLRDTAPQGFYDCLSEAFEIAQARMKKDETPDPAGKGA